MVSRGWPPADLLAMRPAEFLGELEVAVQIAKEEAEAAKAASRKGK